MGRDPGRGIGDLYRRVRRTERRGVGTFRDWIEHTDNLIHVSVLVFLPLLIGLVTYLSNLLEGVLPFLLFPPLASGVYTLFANPESEYASPRRFVGGLTLGAVCGWIALEVAAGYWYDVPAGGLQPHAGAAAFSVLLTGVLAWVLDLEESAAFSTALLVLVTGTGRLVYVASVAASTLLIAGVFIVWRDRFYEQRDEYLYQTTRGDDHVLVPVREGSDATVALGARIAAAHDAGKVVIIDVIGRGHIEEIQSELTADHSGSEDEHGERRQQTSSMDGDTDAAVVTNEEAREYAAAEAATALEGRSRRLESEFDVPCEVIVAFGGGDPGATVLDAAREANCDLIVTPYEESGDGLSGFIRTLFGGEVDVLVHRSVDGRREWTSALVPVRKAGDVAHAMIDFAGRLSGNEVGVCHCIGSERERRRAEEMLANLAETATAAVETRVSETPIESFLQRNDDRYDIVFLGASTNRSAASRFISKPTFQRVSDLDTDVAVVHRG
jgi:nucleotide-binding universal stress UspA family protein